MSQLGALSAGDNRRLAVAVEEDWQQGMCREEEKHMTVCL